jgi:hypothetical protein
MKSVWSSKPSSILSTTLQGTKNGRSPSTSILSDAAPIVADQLEGGADRLHDFGHAERRILPHALDRVLVEVGRLHEPYDHRLADQRVEHLVLVFYSYLLDLRTCYATTGGAVHSLEALGYTTGASGKVGPHHHACQQNPCQVHQQCARNHHQRCPYYPQHR